MPSTVQGLAVLFLAVLPGFVAIAVIRHTRPVRQYSPFEAVVWCVFYSAIIDIAQLVLFAFIAKKIYGDKFAEPFKLGFEQWLPQALPDHLREFGLWGGGYVILSIVLAVGVGLVVGTMTDGVVPVWYRETVGKSIRWSWWRPRKLSGISVLVELENRDRYFGTLKTAPTDYDVLISEKKDFSLVDVVYISAERRESPVRLLPHETVLLNTRNVLSIRVVESPLRSR